VNANAFSNKPFLSKAFSSVADAGWRKEDASNKDASNMNALRPRWLI
jgi:hypothetical protein